MDELVQRLCERAQRIRVGGQDPSVAHLRVRIEEIEHVFIRFDDTHGGTELGLTIDRWATDISRADFEVGRGEVHLEGTTTLNFVPVRCVADVLLPELTGTARLLVAEED